MPEGHKEIWQYLIDNKMNYPDGTFVPPFRKPEKNDKPRRISVAQFDATESNILGFPRVIRLRVCDGGSQYEIPLLGDRNPARSIERVLFTFSRRGWLTVFPTGNTTDFRIMAQQYIVPLLHKGYRIQPINAGSELIALKVQKGKHTWYLIDYAKAVGIEYEKPTECRLVGKHAQHALCKCLEMAHAVLSTIQNHLIDVFHVSLQLSIGSVAIKAAKHAMLNDLMKWRPHPLMVTMCRLGGAFRGGFIVGRGFRGPAWMVDTNRLYTWALTRKLPYRVALSSSVTNGVLRDGIYVCTIIGPGTFPIYVPVWGDRTSGFSVSYWNGDKVYTVLTTSEIDGIRALGYQVKTGYGFQFVQTFNMATYVEKLLATVNKYGRNHPLSRITKSMGNSVYGKFGESPERIDSIFSIDRPSPDCFPFIDSNGDEIENLWERKRVRYNSHQHVDIAATITGYGRDHMYGAIKAIIDAGGIIAATNTDSIITNVDPSGTLHIDATAIGKWRNVAYDADGITVARNAWAVGEHIALSGAPAHDRHTIELIARHEQVILHGIQKARLLPGGPTMQRYTFTGGSMSRWCGQDLTTEQALELDREMAISSAEPSLVPS